jgi:uncharacterized protein YchJ
MAAVASVLFQAFTVKAQGGVLREIVTGVGVSVPFDPASGDPRPPVHQSKALWDTGATGSVVTKATARALNLQPTALAQVHHAGGVSEQNVYLVNLYLPNGVVMQAVRVTECEGTEGGWGAIIGMDVICTGDFAVTNVAGVTTVSFRYPSCETIDYVVEAQAHTANQLKAQGAKRNDQCFCGSGKKYKYCHGKMAH